MKENYNKKKSIAFLGNVSEKKGPFLLLHAFKAIHDFDPEFTLHIAGKMQSSRVVVSWDHLIPKLGLTEAIHYMILLMNLWNGLRILHILLTQVHWKGTVFP